VFLVLVVRPSRNQEVALLLGTRQSASLMRRLLGAWTGCVRRTLSEPDPNISRTFGAFGGSAEFIFALEMTKLARRYRMLGRPLTAETRVRIPVAVLVFRLQMSQNRLTIWSTRGPISTERAHEGRSSADTGMRVAASNGP
jgi:hypothetical protein